MLLMNSISTDKKKLTVCPPYIGKPTFRKYITHSEATMVQP